MDWQLLHSKLDQFGQSEPFNTLIVGAVGAIVGAISTQVVTGMSQRRQAAIAELTAVRAACGVCFTIANRMIALKRQSVRPKWTAFVAARATCEAAIARKQVHHFAADFETVPVVKLPIDLLERLAFEKISIQGRALQAAVDLVGAADGLHTSIRQRNDLIVEIRAKALADGKLAEVYFGIKTAEGHEDLRYADALKGIYLQTDDCIFFSQILAKDLVAYSERLRRRYIWRRGFPKVHPADWTIAREAGLLPDPNDYKDWLRGFRPQPSLLARIRNRLWPGKPRGLQHR